MSALLTIPEYARFAAEWSPSKEAFTLAQPDFLERAVRGELTLEEEMYLLFAMRSRFPEEFATFCRRALAGCSAEQLARIQAEYEAREELYALQLEQRLRALERRPRLVDVSKDEPA